MWKQLFLIVLLSFIVLSTSVFSYQDFNINQDFDSDIDGFYFLTACSLDLYNLGKCDGLSSFDSSENMTVQWNSMNQSLEILDWNTNLSKGVEVHVYATEDRPQEWFKNYDSYTDATAPLITIPKDKEAVIFVRYYINDTSNMFTGYPVNRLFVTRIDGLISHYSFPLTTGWHELTAYIPANFTHDNEYLISLWWRWLRTTSARLLLVDRFAVYTFDDEDIVTGVTLGDPFVKEKCNSPSGYVQTSDWVNTALGVDTKFIDNAVDGHTCFVLLMGNVSFTRRQLQNKTTCTQTGAGFTEPCFRVLRDFFMVRGAHVNSRNKVILEQINPSVLRATSWDTEGSGNIGDIEFSTTGSVNLTYIHNQTYNTTGDIPITASGSQWRFMDAGSYGWNTTWYNIFDDECIGQSICDVATQHYINVVCNAEFIKDCGDCGCLNDFVCKEGVDRWYCSSDWERSHENITCHVTSSYICQYGCNETTSDCNPNPETGQEQIFCISNSDCVSYCTSGAPSNRFYNGQCISNECSYTMEYCEYGCDPFSGLCAGAPITETGLDWCEVYFGWDESVCKFFIFLMTSLVTSTLIVYAINRVGGSVGGTGIGTIFGIVTILWLIFFTVAGWVSPVIFVVLIILAGFITVYSMLKFFGG